MSQNFDSLLNEHWWVHVVEHLFIFFSCLKILISRSRKLFTLHSALCTTWWEFELLSITDVLSVLLVMCLALLASYTFCSATVHSVPRTSVRIQTNATTQVWDWRKFCVKICLLNGISHNFSAISFAEQNYFCWSGLAINYVQAELIWGGNEFWITSQSWMTDFKFRGQCICLTFNSVRKAISPAEWSRFSVLVVTAKCVITFRELLFNIWWGSMTFQTPQQNW